MNTPVNHNNGDGNGKYEYAQNGQASFNEYTPTDNEIHYSHNGQQGLSIATLIFTDLDASHFEKIGFNCAFSNNPETTYQETEQIVTRWMDAIGENLNNNHTKRCGQTTKAIEEVSGQIDRLRKNKTEHLEKLESLKTELSGKDALLTETYTLLKEKLREFATAREQFFNTVISKTKTNLSDLTQFYLELSSQRNDAEAELQNQNRAFHTHETNKLQKEHDHHYKLWEDTIETLGLHGPGISPWFVRIILSISLTTALFAVSPFVNKHFDQFITNVLSPPEMGIAGLLIVVLTTAVAYYYIRSVVEHRLLNSKVNSGTSHHYELFIAGILFFAGAGGLLASIILPQSVDDLTMLLCYLTTLFSLSYILGFFVRMAILLNFKNNLEKKLQKINSEILTVAFPANGQLSEADREKFRTEYVKQLDSLYELLSKRSTYATDSLKSDIRYRYWWWDRIFIVRHIIKIGKYVIRRIRSYIWPIDDGDEVFYVYDRELLASQSFKIHPWEKVWLPELATELETLRKDVASLEIEIKDLKHTIHLYETEETETSKTLDAKIARLQNSLRYYETMLSKHEQEYMQQKSLADQFRIKVLYSLKKGYNVGRWYFTENGVKNIVPAG
jgi:hypothetical protein